MARTRNKSSGTDYFGVELTDHEFVELIIGTPHVNGVKVEIPGEGKRYVINANDIFAHVDGKVFITKKETGGGHFEDI